MSYLIKCPNLYVGVHMLQNFKNYFEVRYCH